MYKAIGVNTNIVYGYADHKSELMRKLSESFRRHPQKQKFYPEPLRIENEDAKESKIEATELTKQSMRKLLYANLETSETAREIVRRETRKAEKATRIFTRVKITTSDGNTHFANSIQKASNITGLGVTRIGYLMNRGLPDSNSNRYERVEEYEPTEER